MAKHNKQMKMGSKLMRVNKQKPGKVHESTKRNDLFIGKTTPIYHMPLNLKQLLKKYNNTDLSNRHDFNNNKKKKSLGRKNIINSFTAFRIYHSRFGKTYEDQENLSKELADFWKNNPSLQASWRGYAEEYKASATKMPFVTWFDTYKSAVQVMPQPEDALTQSNRISHLIVEDVYTSNLHFNE